MHLFNIHLGIYVADAVVCCPDPLWGPRYSFSQLPGVWSAEDPELKTMWDWAKADYRFPKTTVRNVNRAQLLTWLSFIFWYWVAIELMLTRLCPKRFWCLFRTQQITLKWLLAPLLVKEILCGNLSLLLLSIYWILAVWERKLLTP